MYMIENGNKKQQLIVVGHIAVVHNDAPVTLQYF